MRRVIVLCAVVALICIVSVNQASAFGWRHRACHCRTAVVAAPQTVTADVAPTVSPSPADESVAMSAVLDAMQGVLQREYALIQFGLSYYEECDDSSTYGSD